MSSGMAGRPEGRNKATDVLPASQYLQDRLQERRARNTRPRKSRQSDFGPQTTTGRDDDIFEEEPPKRASRQYDSSPIAPAAPSRYGSDAGSASTAVDHQRKRAPGVRQLNQQIDILTKQNFDLKLELDHRRKHQAKLNQEMEKMRAVVARAERLTQEHAELLRINSELVEELEKRDKAMQEAVDIICSLEEKIDDMEDDRQSTTRSFAQADSGYAGTETQEAPQSSPPDIARMKKAAKYTSSNMNAAPAAAKASQNLNQILDVTPARPKREPMFMSQKKGDTQALRSVYLETTKQLHPVKSFHSILSKHASTIYDGESIDEPLDSPRLSNLSESSFPSIYSPKKISPDRQAWEPEDDVVSPISSLPSHTRQDSISRISRWIEGHDLAETPSKTSHIHLLNDPSIRSMSTTPTAVPQQDDHFQSLGDALVSKRSKHEQVLPFRPQTSHNSGSQRGTHTPTSFGGPIFGEPLLSPSPDSASQRLLRSSRSTIVGEKSILDTTPAHLRGFDALEPGLRTAPKQMRSSVELSQAYTNNMQYHKTGLSTIHQAEQALYSDDDLDQDSGTIRDFPDYLGYPDGNSILMGTPSRFLKHDKPPAADLFFDGNDLSSSSPEAQRKARRRRSKSAAINAAAKPTLQRAGTSPSVPLSLHVPHNATRPIKSAHGADVTSPVSYQSSSSSNRTALGTNDSRARTMSPELSPMIPRQQKPTPRETARVSASPGRPGLSLTQKTQQLIRRLSGSHGSDWDRDVRDRQISPSPSRPTLPTLTSTPSSAYVNIIPKEVRRANPQLNESAKPQQPQLPSLPKAASSRNPADTPSKAEADVRIKSPTSEKSEQKRSFFTRRGSSKETSGLDRAKTVGHQGKSPSSRGRRRSSVRDAVSSGKLGWR